jgi:8-oxo-dGTP pyrophosphatase MutT (NUDIX family)
MVDLRRRAVRVMLIDEEGAVLMVQGFDPHLPEVTYWYTVGGGVEVGESDVDAAVREVWEETGRTIEPDDLIGPISRDEVVFPFEGRTIEQQQLFFGVLVDRFDPAPAAFDDIELRSTIGLDWIDPRTAAAAGLTLYPSGLAELVNRVLVAASDSTTSAPTSQNWL